MVLFGESVAAEAESGAPAVETPVDRLPIPARGKAETPARRDRPVGERFFRFHRSLFRRFLSKRLIFFGRGSGGRRRPRRPPGGGGDRHGRRGPKGGVGGTRVSRCCGIGCPGIL